jgi:A/G-specific adenine glycosylase
MAAGTARERRSRRAILHEAPFAAGPALPFLPEAFRRQLLAWYRKHARTLPWRGIRNPYATWLSEIMLQQTRVATVTARYVEFLQRFPTLQALAEAEEDAVLALWSGLGYYRRARMLHRGAQFVQRELGGKLPRTATALRTLPGVGEYTAAAIASIAFGESVAVLDGNVERVLLRILGLAEDRSGKARAHLAGVAQTLVPPSAKRRERSNPPGDHNQAMMELGATICLPRQPLCLQCPVMSLCQTRGEHPISARDKPQSRVVAHLLALRKRGTVTEVLLLRRPVDATLMANMLELPPLPLEAVAGREPVLRLRHAITNTNYYVQVFAESAPGIAPLRLDHEPAGEWNDSDDLVPNDLVSEDPAEEDRGESAEGSEEIADSDGGDTGAAVPEGLSQRRPTIAQRRLSSFLDEADLEDMDEVTGSELDPRLTAPEGSLLAQIPANRRDLEWTSTVRLRARPLTGLARKVLQRLGVMIVPKVRVS